MVSMNQMRDLIDEDDFSEFFVDTPAQESTFFKTFVCQRHLKHLYRLHSKSSSQARVWPNQSLQRKSSKSEFYNFVGKFAIIHYLRLIGYVCIWQNAAFLLYSAKMIPVIAPICQLSWPLLVYTFLNFVWLSHPTKRRLKRLITCLILQTTSQVRRVTRTLWRSSRRSTPSWEATRWVEPKNRQTLYQN